MTRLLLCVLLITGSLTHSCTDDDFQPNCEVIANEIRELIDLDTFGNSSLTGTTIYYNGRVVADQGLPTIEGCILKYNNTSFNLDQAISYESEGQRLIIRFV